MSIYKLSKSNYWVAFVCLMLLNVLLAFILWHSVLAQTSDDIIRDQPPVVAEVIKQKDCPLSITVINVDNSALSFQRVDFVLQNTGNKSIRAYVLLGQAKTTGKINTNSFATKLLQTGEFHNDEVFMERKAIKESGRLFLSLDYVEFEDGSSWGADSQGFSKNIAGERAGRLAAIRKTKDLITSRNLTDLTNLLNQNVAEMTVNVPESTMSDGWQKGYRTGYKGVFSILQRSKEGGIEALSTKLDEIEKFAK